MTSPPCTYALTVKLPREPSDSAEFDINSDAVISVCKNSQLPTWFRPYWGSSGQRGETFAYTYDSEGRFGLYTSHTTPFIPSVENRHWGIPCSHAVTQWKRQVPSATWHINSGIHSLYEIRLDAAGRNKPNKSSILQLPCERT